jgi:hypothetical protein
VKSILVGKINDSRLYYVVDSIDSKSDGVIVDGIGDVSVVSFWGTIKKNSVNKINNNSFHDYLWNGHKSEASGHWYSVFVTKAVPVSEELLDGAVINYDVLRRKSKMLDYENRAIDYRTSVSSQSISAKMLARFIELEFPKRKKRGKRNSKYAK